jgi:signal transduction histidine kinase/DNA-binding response OmpR family regulator
MSSVKQFYAADIVDAHLELARRSVPSALSYFGLLLVVGLFTPYRQDHPWIFSVVTVSVLLIGVARTLLAQKIERMAGHKPGWGRAPFRFGVMSIAVIWSAFSTLTLSHYPQQGTGMIVLLMTAGLAAGGHTSLAPDLVMSKCYLAVMLLPAIAGAAITGGAQGYSLAVTITILGVFLLIESRHQHDTFWRGVEDRAALSAKATELEEAKKLADEGTIAKSNFLAKMSHEIRTPMNAVIGMTELLLDSGLDAQRERFVRTIKDSSESLLEIVNDILDLSKIEAGRIELDNADFDLRESVHDVLRVLSLRAHSKGLELSCRVRPDVPSSLCGDGGRLRQILVNLVGNAIKFTPSGSVLVEIEAQEQAGDWVLLHFTVVDTGIGIHVEHRKRIFEPFAQADSSTTRQYGGTGLGLSISRALVEMMHGKLWCESEPERGSTFHFTARFGARKGRHAASLPGASSLVGRHVLIVEDATENARILAEMIQSWRMQPTIVRGNEAAAALLGRSVSGGGRFDFILVDQEMDGESGFSLAEYIVGREGLAKPIMMLTSVAQTENVEQCRKLGLDIYLIKPVSESDLFDAMMSLRGSVNEAKRPMEATADPQRRLERLHVLVVEDNAVNQEVAEQLLLKRGYSVTIASNGREAVDFVAKSPEFDLILMDIQMPEMDGFQATAAIRELEKKSLRHIPIVAMTAHAMKGDRERCLASGMDGYISKPVQSRDLYETIEGITGRAPSPQVPDPVTATPAPEPEESVNLDEILDRLGGNISLLQSIVALFEEDYPVQMVRIREAIKANDPVALSSAAHTLKGSLLVLAAGRASEAAVALERLGRESRVVGADVLLATLEAEVKAVSADLRKIVTERFSVATP